MKKLISLGGGARWGITAVVLALPMLAFAVEPTDLDGAKTANGKIVIEYLQMCNDGKFGEAAKKYFSPKAIDHGNLGMYALPPRPAPPAGGPVLPPGFAPPHSDVKKLIVQGDLVFAHIHVTGGEGAGPGVPPPRNGELMWDLYRVKDGKIVEHWNTHNEIPDEQVGKQW